MSMVSVNFGSGYGTVLESDEKATFSDKLGTIGGTFGMFVGMSFFGIVDSLIEGLVWLLDKLGFKRKS